MFLPSYNKNFHFQFKTAHAGEAVKSGWLAGQAVKSKAESAKRTHQINQWNRGFTDQIYGWVAWKREKN